VNADLDSRLTALAEAAELADGRLDDQLVDDARTTVAKAGARLGLGVDQTVVALAGPTGAGKSLLFNALTETELASVGRRRPTTATGQAASWGGDADALLDWLEIVRRHRLDRDGLEGLVLLDLPDFDSVETAHRLEVDRLVALVDLLVWVVEPQKYADASLHDRYLRPLASHAPAMAVVLNQADLLGDGEVEAWQQDARRLLGEDGLHDVPLLVVSARTGVGLDELRELLAQRVAAREAAVSRLAADVEAVAGRLGAACGGGKPAGIDRDDRKRLVAALEDAAGVPAVVRAVDAAHRRRGALDTGWPFVRWILRLRPDPLRRLRLPDTPREELRTSRPAPTDVQRAQVETAARKLADGASAGLPPPWPRLVRERATARDEELADRLDRAVAGADLSMKRPRWWLAAALLQRVLALAVFVGMLWLLGLAALGYLRVDDVVPLPEVRGVPIPTWLLVGGVLAGLLLAFVARLVNGVGARRRARSAARSLRERVEVVGRVLVLEPVEAELDERARLCTAIETARGRPTRR
jgi:GTP-binding protein EngB required for normal cell division